MNSSVVVFDPTVNDELSRVRGVGRYLQLLKENLPQWIFTNNLAPLRPLGFEGRAIKQYNNKTIFINPFFSFINPPLVMRRVAQKQIAIIHDLIPFKYPEHFPIGIRGNINVFLNKLALKNYDLIITDSEASKKDIVQMLKIQPEKIKIVYPCLPNIFINPKSKILNPKQIQNPNDQNIKSFENLKLKIENSFCLYVGDATWNKNLVNLAKAIKIANVTCVFAGKVFEKIKQINQKTENRKSDNQSSDSSDFRSQLSDFSELTHPWQKELREFIKLTNGDKRFIFAGFIDDYKLIKLYQQAKVNILVSRDEGFGFSYLEAANFGCPSILADIPVLKEIAVDAASFADPDSPNDIANKISEIYMNSDLRDKLAFKAQEQARKFNQNKFKDEFLKILTV